MFQFIIFNWCIFWGVVIYMNDYARLYADYVEQHKSYVPRQYIRGFLHYVSVRNTPCNEWHAARIEYMHACRGQYSVATIKNYNHVCKSFVDWVQKKNNPSSYKNRSRRKGIKIIEP